MENITPQEVIAKIDGIKAGLASKDELTKALEAVATKAEVSEIAKSVEMTAENVQKLNEAMTAAAKKEQANAPSFKQAASKIIQENIKDIQMLERKKGSITFDIKLVGDMTTAASLTGDGVHTYNQRQGIVPNQRINFRDLVPTVVTDTLSYVTFRETGTDGAIGVQTEGQSKSQIDYDFTEVKTINKYIAGYATFAKQLAYNLPFLENTLQRMLLRDFYKKENDYLFDVAYNAATGSTTTSETDDVLQIIDLIANQEAANFTPSIVLVGIKSKYAMLKEMFENGYYAGSGSIVGTPAGAVTIAGVPIIGASFITGEEVMIIDADFVERVQAEALSLTFSSEEGNNFTKNLITAKVECLEELAILRTDAHIASVIASA